MDRATASERPRPTGPPRAVLDTCVLFPKSVRGLLTHLAADGAFTPVWSERILSELQGSLANTHATSQARHAIVTGLRLGFPGALVSGERLSQTEAAMTNHPKDRHVLAAAVVSGAPEVVTTNLKDFPAAALAQVGVQALHPDAFLSRMLERSPATTREALQAQARGMGPAGWTPGQLLGHLGGLGRANPMLPGFVGRAEQEFGWRAVPPPAAPSAVRPLGLQVGLSRRPETRSR